MRDRQVVGLDNALADHGPDQPRQIVVEHQP
jgi:hypothetical protein